MLIQQYILENIILLYLQISSSSFSLSKGFGWCVDRNEYKICFFDCRNDISREEEILIPALLNDLVQPRLIDR